MKKMLGRVSSSVKPIAEVHSTVSDVQQTVEAMQSKVNMMATMKPQLEKRMDAMKADFESKIFVLDAKMDEVLCLLRRPSLTVPTAADSVAHMTEQPLNHAVCVDPALSRATSIVPVDVAPLRD